MEYCQKTFSILSWYPVNLYGLMSIRAILLDISENISTEKDLRDQSSQPLILEFSWTMKGQSEA